MASFQLFLYYHADAAGQNGLGSCCKTSSRAHMPWLPFSSACVLCRCNTSILCSCSRSLQQDPCTGPISSSAAFSADAAIQDMIQCKRSEASIRTHMLGPISNSPPQCSQGDLYSGRPPAPSHSPAEAPAQIQVEFMGCSISWPQYMTAEGLRSLCKCGQRHIKQAEPWLISC